MTDTVDKSIDEQLDNILGMNCYFIHHSCASEADPADGFGYCSCGVEKETKQAIKDLIATEVLHARIEELSNLKAEKGRFSTSSYGLWVDGAIDNRIVELEAQLNKSFSYQITKSNKEIKTQLEDKS